MESREIGKAGGSEENLPSVLHGSHSKWKYPRGKAGQNVETVSKSFSPISFEKTSFAQRTVFPHLQQHIGRSVEEPVRMDFIERIDSEKYVTRKSKLFSRFSLFLFWKQI